MERNRAWAGFIRAFNNARRFSTLSTGPNFLLANVIKSAWVNDRNFCPSTFCNEISKNIMTNYYTVQKQTVSILKKCQKGMQNSQNLKTFVMANQLQQPLKLIWKNISLFLKHGVACSWLKKRQSKITALVRYDFALAIVQGICSSIPFITFQDNTYLRKFCQKFCNDIL